MIRILMLFTVLTGSQAFAQESKIVLNSAQVLDLEKVDSIGCHIEVRGKGMLRILSTGQNSSPNRYVDLDLSDKDFKITQNADGWTLKKQIDLAEKAINPLFPKLLYGVETTELTYSVVEGLGQLNVKFVASTVLKIDTGKTKFTCHQSNMILDKSGVCPTCLSALKTN